MQHQRLPPLLRIEIDVARTHGQAVDLAHNQAGNDFNRKIQVAHHAANDGDLRRVFLSEEGGVRFDDVDSDAMRALLRRLGAAQAGVSLSEDTIARLSTPEALFRLVTYLGDSFLPSFIAILGRRTDESVVPSERRWQLLRRGRAVEFNLVVDRGTKFGLAAPGVKPENVLVGLPPEARWEYCSELGAEDQDTEEAEMVKILKEPRSWVD